MLILYCIVGLQRDTYRLGDGYFGLLSKGAERDIIKRYPNSILTKYLQRASGNMDSTSMRMILKETCPKYVYPNGRYIAIHLRTGDVICGNRWHEINKRPYNPSYFKKYSNHSNVYIFSKPFFSAHSSKPCVKESDAYIKTVLKKTRGTLFVSVNADHAFCVMVKAHEFIPGKGYFSKTIQSLRAMT